MSITNASGPKRAGKEQKCGGKMNSPSLFELRPSFFSLFFFFFFVFLGLYLWHMEVPRLGVELEPQLPAYTIATAMPDLSRVCNLHHSSQ